MILAPQAERTSETRVVLAMRWELVRRGIAGMLHELHEAGLGVNARVVGEAQDAQEVFRLVGESKPDLVIGRANLLGMDAPEFTCRLNEARGARMPLVILARMMDPVRVCQAWACGVSGYLHSEIDLQTLAAAIHAVRSGNLIMCAEAEAAVRERLQQRPRAVPALAGMVEALTAREREVMDLVAAGLSNKEIAFRMGIGRRTAEMHVAKLIDKFGMASRSELLVALLSR
jgi:DNA-binding NarL/FixJ family response regulator